ncbi:MAG: hypothetical protein AB1Z31_28695, partial [Desulfobacterales bacterium]
INNVAGNSYWPIVIPNVIVKALFRDLFGRNKNSERFARKSSIFGVTTDIWVASDFTTDQSF